MARAIRAVFARHRDVARASFARIPLGENALWTTRDSSSAWAYSSAAWRRWLAPSVWFWLNGRDEGWSGRVGMLRRTNRPRLMRFVRSDMVFSRGTPRPAALHCQTDKRRGPDSRPVRVAWADEGVRTSKSGVGSANWPLEHQNRQRTSNLPRPGVDLLVRTVAVSANDPKPGLHCQSAKRHGPDSRPGRRQSGQTPARSARSIRSSVSCAGRSAPARDILTD